jgi:hypothetical protein
MPDRFSKEEFDQLMKTWDPSTKGMVEERMATNYTRERLEEFSEDEAATMRAALERLIPQSEEVDLVGFIDRYAGDPLGRGDKKPGVPPTKEVFHLGIKGLNEIANTQHQKPFAQLGDRERDEILRTVQEGKAKGGAWDRVPSDYFFEHFYGKALHGYFSHPRAWMRIGFMGAAYPEGYRWLGRAQVKQRHERTIGWDVM